MIGGVIRLAIEVWCQFRSEEARRRRAVIASNRAMRRAMREIDRAVKLKMRAG